MRHGFKKSLLTIAVGAMPLGVAVDCNLSDGLALLEGLAQDSGGDFVDSGLDVTIEDDTTDDGDFFSLDGIF